MHLTLCKLQSANLTLTQNSSDSCKLVRLNSITLDKVSIIVQVAYINVFLIRLVLGRGGNQCSNWYNSFKQ